MSGGRRPIHVLELRSVRGTGGGPEKTILLGAARTDPTRVRVTVCYVRDRRDDVFAIDQRAAAMDVEYTEVVERHSFDASIITALRVLVRERQVDIVHAHDYKTNLLALVLARLDGIAPLTTAHGWSGTSRRERLYYWLDRRLIPRFPLAIAVSEPIRRTLIDAGADPGRVRRIPNGIDDRYFARDRAAGRLLRRVLGIPASAVVVGTVGRLDHIKRHDLLLRAVATIDDPMRPFILLAGDGPCRADIAASARRLGLQDRLMLLGHRDDVREVHQALDIHVQTSDSEGLPNALLEAMATGTPVIATNVGGTPELVRDGVDGLLVPRGDVEAISDAIARVMANPGEAAHRADAARARIEREWSFGRRMAAVERVYRDLMVAGGASGAVGRQRECA